MRDKHIAVAFVMLMMLASSFAVLPEYEDWKAFHGVGDDQENTDGDRWPAMAEYLLGLDPGIADGDNAAPWMLSNTNHAILMNYAAELQPAAGFEHRVEWSEDLQHWSSEAVAHTVPPQEQNGRMQYFRRVPTGGRDRMFARMRVHTGKQRFSFCREAEVLDRTGVGAALTRVPVEGEEILELAADDIGDALEVTLPDVPAGRYTLSIRYRSGSNNGIAQASIDGSDIGTPLDQYAATVAWQEAGLGTIRIDTNGAHRVALMVTGQNAASGGYTLTLDKICLKARPNVIIFYSDDHNPEHLGVYGGNTLTPRLDQLAAEGMRFTRFHIASPVCAPSRYTVMTGRYASRSHIFQRTCAPGSYPNIGWNTGIYNADEVGTLPLLMQAAGYKTGFVGKWHMGAPAMPYQRGTDFSEDAAPSDPDWADTEAMLESNQVALIEAIHTCGFDYAASVYKGNPIDGSVPTVLEVHNQEWVTEGALDFIDQNQDDPFFLYMPCTLTHGPNNLTSLNTDPSYSAIGTLDSVPDVQPTRQSVIDRVSGGGYSTAMQSYGSTWLDDGVDAVLDKIDALGLTNDTVVFFAADHGISPGKFTCYEHGALSPLIVRWPGKIRAGTVCHDLASNIDLSATIYDICGIEFPYDQIELDGRSLRGALTEDGTYSRPSLYLEITSTRAVVTDAGHKYIAVRFPPEIQAEVDAGNPYTHWQLPWDERHHTYNAENDYPHYLDQDQLYDLNIDSDEQTNVCDNAAYPESRGALRALLTRYCANLEHAFAEFTPQFFVPDPADALVNITFDDGTDFLNPGDIASNANLTVSAWTDNDGTIGNWSGQPSTGRAIVAKSWVDGNAYTFTVEVAGGYQMHINSIQFDERPQDGDSMNFDLLLNGSSIGAGALSDGWGTVTLSDLGLTGLTGV
ncbi:MAG: sulfatase-like hydrolase/transferase, partial [Kiritimatiellales bacterium]|nr:sulfatase-like hydrolase/transferase [Kiritimatiellales bacterium]